MYGLILIFIIWGNGTTGGSITHSEKIIAYPSQAACEAALSGAIAYEQGVEAGQGKKDQVAGWCIPLMYTNTTGT